MVKQNAIKVFEEKKVRTLWDSETKERYFSIVDEVAVLTDSENPRRYWSDLKRKLAKEGSQLYEGIVQLKMLSSDGKYYKTMKLESKTGKSVISPLNAKDGLLLSKRNEENE